MNAGRRTRRNPSGSHDDRRAWLRRTLLALVFCGTALTVTGPALLTGDTLGATDILQFAAPYREDLPHLPEVGNSLQTDQMEQIPVVAQFYRSARQGELQLWDPNLALGVPLLPAVHNRILAPWNVVFLFVPPAVGTTVATALALVAGQAGTYALARRLRIGMWGALLAAVAYVFSGPSMAMLLRIHEVLLFPVLLYAVHGALTENARRGRFLALTSLSAAAVLLSGFPAAGLTIGYATVPFALAVCWHRWRAGTGRSALLGAAATTGLSGVAGVLVAAVVLLPSFQFLAMSGSLEREFGSAHRAGLPKLASTVSGRFFGTYQHDSWWWPEAGYSNPFEASLTAGLIVLGLLAILALAPARLRVSRTADRLLGTVLLPTALVAVVATYLGGPVLGLLQLLPYVDTSSFGRARFIASLVLALAAGAALDGLWRDGSSEPAGRPGGLVRVQVFALLGLVALGTYEGVTEAARLGALELVASAVTVPLAAAATALLAVRHGRERQAVAGLVVAAACVGELVWGAWGFTPTSPSAWFYPDSPAFASIQPDVTEGGLYRFASLGLNPVPANASSYLGLRDLRIAFPAWERYRQLMEAADPAVWEHRRLRPTFTDHLDEDSPVLDAMAVAYLVEPLSAPPLQVGPPERFALPAAALPLRMEVPVPEGGIRRLVVPLDVEADCVDGWIEADVGGTLVRRLVRELGAAAELPVPDVGAPADAVPVEVRSTHCRARTSGVAGGVHGPQPGGLLELVSTDGWAVYRRPGARPRVELAGGVVRIDGHRRRLAYLAARPADGPVVTEAGPTSAGYGGGTAILTTDDPDRVTVRVDSRGPGLLVVRDSYAPGWEAEIDGVPAAVVPVDHALRGVEVHGGRSEVVLRYRPPLMVTGGWLSLAGLALTAALATGSAAASRRWPGARPRRRPPRPAASLAQTARRA